MRIDYNGNVGIGTSSPTKKLSVVGDISCNGDIHLGNSQGNGQFLRRGLIFPYPNPILIGSAGSGLNFNVRPVSTHNFSIAIGHGATGASTNTIALGQNAQADGNLSIAIGASRWN